MVNEHKYTIFRRKSTLKTSKVLQQAFYIFLAYRVLAMYFIIGQGELVC